MSIVFLLKRINMRLGLTLFLLLVIAGLEAQPPVPELCAVSVDTATDKPVLYWNVSDTSRIDGFIIKRVIWNGTGVLDGTLNNVAVLPDNSLTSFVDTTTTYGTQASPDIRKEQYVVVSYRDTAGYQVYSGFSQMVSTIFLQAKYDSCSTKIKLVWTAGQNVDRYDVFLLAASGMKRLVSTQDTEFVYNTLQPGTYRFIIRASLKNPCHVDSVLSNIAIARTGLFQKPQMLYIQGVSALNNDSLLLNVHVHLPPSKPQVKLYMDGTEVAAFDTDFDSDYLVRTSAGEAHRFIMRAYSSCGNLIDSSNIAHNIVLNGQYSQQGSQVAVSLTWNKYDYSAGQTSGYEVYFSIDGMDYTFLVQGNDTSYVHVLNQLINSQTLPSSLYYYVSARQVYDTLVGGGITVNSNIIEVMPQPLLFLPNAINPVSPNEQDRRFVVHINFVDSFELTIFDRYGRVLFHTTDPFRGWDGRGKNGKLVPVDTYFYLLKYVSHGKKYKVRGSVSVIY